MTTTTEAPTTTATDAWEALHRAHVTITRHLQTRPGFTPITLREYDVLDLLSRTDDLGVRLNQLNRSLTLTQSSLSRMLERLENQGYVYRWTDPTDLRGLRIRLTDHGRTVHQDITTTYQRHVHTAMTTNLTPEELDTLTRLATKLHTR